MATVRVEKSWAPFHVAGTGYGVGIGRYSDGTETSPKFQVAWPTEFGADVTFGDVLSIVDIIYPVGAIYVSTQSTSPEDLFPGTEWDEIHDVFLLAEGDVTAGTTGGADSSTHSHVAPIMTRNAGLGAVAINGTSYGSSGKSASTASAASETLSADVGLLRTDTATVNTMPPYLAVYMWRRTA